MCVSVCVYVFERERVTRVTTDEGNESFQSVENTMQALARSSGETSSGDRVLEQRNTSMQVLRNAPPFCSSHAAVKKDVGDNGVETKNKENKNKTLPPSLSLSVSAAFSPSLSVSLCCLLYTSDAADDC